MYEYSLTYRTSQQIDFKESHLNWNVTGADWKSPIEAASATIKLPKSIPAAAVSLEGFIGEARFKKQTYKQVKKGENIFGISTAQQINPGEGFSVVVDFPDGYLEGSDSTTKEGTSIEEAFAEKIVTVAREVVLEYVVYALILGVPIVLIVVVGHFLDGILYIRHILVGHASSDYTSLFDSSKSNYQRSRSNSSNGYSYKRSRSGSNGGDSGGDGCGGGSGDGGGCGGDGGG